MRLLHPITQYPSHAPISAPSDLSWYSSSSFFRLLTPLPPLPSFHYLVLFHCCSRSFSFRSLLPILPLLLFSSSFLPFILQLHTSSSSSCLSVFLFLVRPSLPSSLILLYSFPILLPSSSYHNPALLLFSSIPLLPLAHLPSLKFVPHPPPFLFLLPSAQ